MLKGFKDQSLHILAISHKAVGKGYKIYYIYNKLYLINFLFNSKCKGITETDLCYINSAYTVILKLAQRLKAQSINLKYIFIINN